MELELRREPTSTPAGLVRRTGAFLLREFREILPPTIFFFIGFNLILLTTNLLLADYGEAFGSFMLATAAALVVGKAVLVANAMRSIRRYDRAPLIRPVLFKTAFYWAIVFGRAPARTLDPVLACRTPSTGYLPAAFGCDLRLASLRRDPALDIRSVPDL
jgi:hypothetical protein